jgi:hypothetical protein
VFQAGRQRSRHYDAKGSIMPASDPHDHTTNDGLHIPPDFNRALILLRHLGVKVVEHRDGIFTGIFKDCHILGPSCRASVEKTTLLKLLRHFWKLDPRRLVNANGELKHVDNIPEDDPERDEAKFRAWLKEQQAAYDQTVGQKTAASVKHEPEPVSPASRRSLHPLCELFPAIEGAAFDEFLASIKDNGLQEPIVLLDDAILDDRNRYTACLAAGIEPVFVPFQGDDPVRFVLAANIHRRHLNQSQRAVIAADIVTYQHGGDRKSDQSASLRLDKRTHAEAAEMLSVSERSVDTAVKIKKHAEPEDIDAIKKGKATISGVAKKLKPPPAAAKPGPAATKPTRRVVSRDDLPPDAKLTNATSDIVARAMEVFEPKFREWLASKPSDEAKQAMCSIMRASGESLISWSSEIFDDDGEETLTEEVAHIETTRPSSARPVG